MIQPSMIELPPETGVVMDMYTVYGSFESCPDVLEIMMRVVEGYADQNIAHSLTHHYANLHQWNPHEIDLSKTVLLGLQQAIINRLQQYGIACPYSLELYRHHGYSIIMVAKEHT